MKSTITKNIFVGTDTLSVTAHPGVIAISIKPTSQLQVPNKDLDDLIACLIEFKRLRDMEHTIKDIITTDL